MKLEREFLRSKVARRIFVLFVLCALVPIVCLVVLSYTIVSNQLDEQSRRRLHHASKSVGMSIAERLHMLDSRLKRMGFLYKNSGLDVLTRYEKASDELQQPFRSLAIVSTSGVTDAIYGTTNIPPTWRTDEPVQLVAGRSVLFVDHSDTEPRIFMFRALEPSHLKRGILVSEIDTSYLWNPETLPPMTELMVLDGQRRLLFSTMDAENTVTERLEYASSYQFEWQNEDEEYVASAWHLPLKFSFGIFPWTVILSESKVDVLAPMTNFKTIFPLVILLSLWFVLLLSIGQIRRNLVPLEKLQEGTQRIADRQFDSRVEVSSGDEFEELAKSFNAMAGQLGRQFKTISTMAEIDRAVLSTLKTREIVDTVLARLPDILPCDRVSVTVTDLYRAGKASTYVSGDHSNRLDEECEIGSEELQRLKQSLHGLEIEKKGFPKYLAPLAEKDIASALVMPIFMKDSLSAVIALGNSRPREYSEEDIAQARQMTARIAVALSNARLLEDLDQHNWETLITLARVIDASSPWTLGHSERAAQLALKIGREIGLGQEDLVDLHRGALLHDIGKLAIEPSILDKEGKLTDEEQKALREHPGKGARILDAHHSYVKAVPVVEQHHEWWDGGGYPYGLAGEEINLLARIYAVADVYDALTSDRPYRTGLNRAKVVDTIREASGTQFDPEIVAAFLAVMSRERDKPRKKSLHGSPLLTT